MLVHTHKMGGKMGREGLESVVGEIATVKNRLSPKNFTCAKCRRQSSRDGEKCRKTPINKGFLRFASLGRFAVPSNGNAENNFRSIYPLDRLAVFLV